MTDERHKNWDILLKALGGIGLIVTAAIGIGEYIANAGQTATLETNKLDSDQHKLYFDKQLEYYLDVTETVATIATTHDKRKREGLVKKFDTLYYGSMVILEDRGDSPNAGKYQPGEKYTHDANVEQHMIAVHNCLLKNCSDKELERVVAIIHPENQASIRVAKRIGMVKERNILWDARAAYLFSAMA